MAEVLLTALRVNLVLAAAVLLVLAIRQPVRRGFGAHVAYSLWLIPPLAALAAILPLAPVRDAAKTHAAPAEQAWSAFGQQLADVAPGGWGLWLAGAGLGALLVTLSQRAFLRKERAGEAGPAVVGIITPRLVMPAFVYSDFTAEERALIRAHERAHMDRGDPRVTALVAAAQVVLWFNPMVHIGAHFLRRDQELACDATVLARMPSVRKRYAATLLKTQLAAQPLPLGCCWPARGKHPLDERIGALIQAAPSARRRDWGVGAVVVLAVLSCGLAVNAQPRKAEDYGVRRVVFIDMTPSMVMAR